jgi:heme exporter protein A
MFAETIRAHLGQGGSALIATHIDLGLPDASILDVGPYRARAMDPDDFDEAFL